MRNLRQREIPKDTAPRRRRRRRAPIKSFLEWLRAGYPDEAPRTGYSPLLALNGPIALSARQTEKIVAELGEGPTDSIDIAVTITKATNQLPTQAQTGQSPAHYTTQTTHPSDNQSPLGPRGTPTRMAARAWVRPHHLDGQRRT